MLSTVAPGLLLAILLMAPTTSGGGSSLVAAAAASGRPRECMSSARRALAAGPTIWEKARVPNLERYCDLLARAHAQLITSPEAAKASAERADEALPGRAAPAVILARAALAMGALDEAARNFARARAVDPRSVEDPATLHDLARVLQNTGKRLDALAVYRALVPRVDLLSTTDRRVSVLLEAAHASMAAEALAGAAATETASGRTGATHTTSATSTTGAKQVVNDGTGAVPARADRPNLDEAIAYLREARQRPPTQLSGDVLLSLVLALDRSGDKAQADAALADAHRTLARVRSSAPDYLAAPEDRLALEALAVEGSDRAQAIKSWELYLAGAGGKGPWAGAAQTRLEALRKGGGAKGDSPQATPARSKAVGGPKKPGKRP